VIAWLRRHIAAVIGLVLVSVLVIAAWPGLSAFLPCVLPKPQTFESDAWRSADAEGPCGHRQAMAEDLLAHHLDAGMSSTDVVDLLGEPAREPGIAWPDETAIVYKMACWIDCAWLIVDLDTQGRVISGEVATD
jgi:hypothetical protein